jgi:hypothetical protein
MLPAVISHKLARLRRRERLLELGWGLAQWLALSVGCFLWACSLDWLVDRNQETPWLLRVVLLLGHAVVAGGGAVVLVLLPQVRGWDLQRLALRVEQQVPELDHRLISAVQWHRPGADLAGMSLALVAVATAEAQQRLAPLEIEELADRRKLVWTGRLLAGTGMICLLALVVAGPARLWALAQRQFLADVPIPRSFTLVSVTPVVWPAGERVTLRFQVTRTNDLWGWPSRGKVRLYSEEGQVEEYALLPAHFASERQAIFEAEVPPRRGDFWYQAWLGDGRLPRREQVRFEPAPAVVKQDAWVLLPEYVGLRPDGTRYEEYQARGEIAALLGSSARVEFQTQKPVTDAEVELLGRPAPALLAWLPLRGVVAPGMPETILCDLLACQASWNLTQSIAVLDATSQAELGPELVLRRVPAQVQGQQGKAAFDLRGSETSYRIVVRDQYGFRNSDPPKRGIALQRDEPPLVELLPEHLPLLPGEPPSPETEVEGKPIPLVPGGSKVRIAYRAQDAYGLRRARLRYRIVPRDDPDNPTPWMRLPLDEVQAGEDVGAFDPRQGAFLRSGLEDQIEFYAEPSPDPEKTWGRREGGGRFDFHVGALGLRLGDQIEFFVEVDDFQPDPEQSVGRSPIRRKAIVSPAELTRWLLDKAEHENRLRQLERRQRGVLGGSEADR